VDPYWPKPLPNRWLTGEVGGICIDRQDHVISLNRLNLTNIEKLLGKTAAPPVIEYDGAGNIANSWGDVELLPKALHSCTVDRENNIWISGSAGGAIQKWSHDGKTLLLQIGDRTACDGPCGEKDSLNDSKVTLNAPADIAVDPSNGDVYVADGYGNHRVVVFNATGKYLRQWGSAGSAPGQFAQAGGGHPHCVLIGEDNLVYVCDRGNDRIEVFDKKGQLKSIIPIKLGTAFSRAPDGSPPGMRVASANDLAFFGTKQRYLLVDDPGNEQIWILDRTLAHGDNPPPIVGGFGSQGRNAGNFITVHGIDVDSKGTLYTAETIDGRRLQKFVPSGTLSAKTLGTYMGSPHYEPFPDFPHNQ
jgi:DNA-binding beta-propeller fold protein YncE